MFLVSKFNFLTSKHAFYNVEKFKAKFYDIIIHYTLKILKVEISSLIIRFSVILFSPPPLR